MPEYFWEWYKQKGYENLLTKEKCFKNKGFLIRVCIEYLKEKGQKINNLHKYETVDEIIEYLKIGIVWTK